MQRTHPEVRQGSEYATETFYQFLDLRYSILKQFLQIIIIVEKTCFLSLKSTLSPQFMPENTQSTSLFPLTKARIALRDEPYRCRIVIRNRKIVCKTWAVLLIFLLELEISGMAVHRINTSKQQKMLPFLRNCIVKMTLRLFQLFSVVKTMVPTLLREFRRSLQIKKIIRNAPRVLQFADQPKYINQ